MPTGSTTPCSAKTDNQLPVPHPRSTTECGPTTSITMGTMTRAETSEPGACATKNSLVYGRALNLLRRRFRARQGHPGVHAGAGRLGAPPAGTRSDAEVLSAGAVSEPLRYGDDADGVAISGCLPANPRHLDGPRFWLWSPSLRPCAPKRNAALLRQPGQSHERECPVRATDPYSAFGNPP